MRFYISTDLGDDHELSSLNEIEWAVNRLAAEKGNFLCVAPENKMKDVTYCQAAYVVKTKGFFKKTVVDSYFLVEFQREENGGDLYQYSKESRDEAEVYGIFRRFVDEGYVPDFGGWDRELFLDKNFLK